MDIAFHHILILLFFSYAIVPTILLRLMRVGAICRVPQGSNRIAITFDDGPDPRYTPEILDILQRYRIKACFFVVGMKARANPNLLRQIVQAGHDIGIHGFRHKAEWFLGPAATTREIKETSRVIEEITGQKTIFYRPAWGLSNFISLLYCRLKGHQVVLWTFMSWDWMKSATPEGISSNIFKRIRDGAILVFHDSDFPPGAAKGSPARVVAALPKILERLEQQGLKAAPLREIIMFKRGGLIKKCVRRSWIMFDKVLRRLAAIEEMDDTGKSIWRVALRRHKGKNWPLSDGSLLLRGDQYLELHFNNERLMDLTRGGLPPERLAMIALREVRGGLPALARLLKQERFLRVKAVVGITLLHRGSERIGFKIYDMEPGLFKFLTSCYEKWLLGLFHPAGFENLKKYRKELSPKYVVMGRRELLERYDPDANKRDPEV